MVVGLKRGIVRVVPYSAEWPRLFEEEVRRRQPALGDVALDVQHVGSTAIPGMPAKPIVDIAVAIRRFEDGAACVKPLADLGYLYKGENGVPGRHYFVKGTEDARTHYLHMLEIDSDEWKEHLVFRDVLRTDRALAEEYAQLKEQLARRYPADRGAYTDGKSEFVTKVLQFAEGTKGEGRG